MSLPVLAVVVPTHDRATRLPRLFAALAAQTIADDLEVVIVDDASTDGTGALLDRWAEETGGTTIATGTAARPAGPAAARNVGWRTTTAPAVAFVDDDCLPEPEWAAALADRLETHDVVQGRTVPDPIDAGGRGPFSHTIAIDHFTRRFETCNIAYRRNVLERTGGFDETFRRPYGEDIDLGWRALATGATTAFAGDAVVRHEIGPSDPWAAIRRSARVGAMAGVVRRHPGYRDELHARLFTDAAHGWALLGLAGVVGAVTTRRAVPLVALVPYLWHRSVTAPPWQRWKAPASVPVTFAIDLAETAALVRASCRERVVVL